MINPGTRLSERHPLHLCPVTRSPGGWQAQGSSRASPSQAPPTRQPWPWPLKSRCSCPSGTMACSLQDLEPGCARQPPGQRGRLGKSALRPGCLGRPEIRVLGSAGVRGPCPDHVLGTHGPALPCPTGPFSRLLARKALEASEPWSAYPELDITREKRHRNKIPQ